MMKYMKKIKKRLGTKEKVDEQGEKDQANTGGREKKRGSTTRIEALNVTSARRTLRGRDLHRG